MSFFLDKWRDFGLAFQYIGAIQRAWAFGEMYLSIGPKTVPCKLQTLNSKRK